MMAEEELQSSDDTSIVQRTAFLQELVLRTAQREREGGRRCAAKQNMRREEEAAQGKGHPRIFHALHPHSTGLFAFTPGDTAGPEALTRTCTHGTHTRHICVSAGGTDGLSVG